MIHFRLAGLTESRLLLLPALIYRRLGISVEQLFWGIMAAWWCFVCGLEKLDKGQLKKRRFQSNFLLSCTNRFNKKSRLGQCCNKKDASTFRQKFHWDFIYHVLTGALRPTVFFSSAAERE
jgi:hypothetical protein